MQVLKIDPPVFKEEPDGIIRRAFVHLNSNGPEADSLGS